ncbi:unnamed protein product [Phaedon cochleariae]|uniref:DUF4371 domain-containing protein n=1 Tax=Phaedon cochleariae TaxID=80249 RepID=A0A9N9SB86_PHACE|nr:unnamed protein product [Phaedon cochleariae]
MKKKKLFVMSHINRLKRKETRKFVIIVVTCDVSRSEESEIPESEVGVLPTLHNLARITEVENVDPNNVSETDNENEHKDYEPKPKKRYIQRFSEKWKDNFEWVEENTGSKRCKVCSVNIQGSSFHLKRHSESITHKSKMKAFKVTPRFNEFVKDQNKKIQLAMLAKQAELKMVTYLCVHNLPFRLIDTLPTACADMFSDSEIAKQLKIKRKKATQIAVNTLGPSNINNIIKKLRKSYFSIIIDESTDISTKKSLVVMVRFWDEELQTIKDRFLGLLEVEDASAEGLFQLIKSKILDKYKLPYSNIIGLGADDASVMMENIAGADDDQICEKHYNLDTSIDLRKRLDWRRLERGYI